ncbi:aromatic di-alanine and TPR containing protein [Ceratobasidium theobromae]|uniref:Aromatic di-alanine and TPR containing protein n=1 Tax=Ceratobasidium theobromae TaxID=1582974 RepID=A0A5N5QLV9_9AGAM|nr:aromatic di-alanine and TPR containing protein [Ceratobasidium theobromae]
MSYQLSDLGDPEECRCKRLGSLEDIEKEIECVTRAVSLTPEGHPDMPLWLNHLETAHRSRFEQLGELEDIDKAIDCGTRAVSLIPEDYPSMPEWLNNLGIARWHRFGRLGKLEDINNAVECATRVLSLAPASHPSMPLWSSNLGNAHRCRFERLSKPEDIDKAIEYGTRAVSLTPEDDPNMPLWLSNLGVAHWCHFEQLGKLEEIEKAIECGTRAVSLTPEGDPGMPTRLSNLGTAHSYRFGRLGELEDIEKAIDCGTRAVSLSSDDHPSMPGWLNNLGDALHSRFERMGKLEDINKAIECGTRAVSLTPEGHPDMFMRLNNLGNAHRCRFERLGDLEDIKKAIEFRTRAVSSNLEDHPSMPLWLYNLGNSHQSRFERLGNLEDIDKAIECATYAVSLTPEGHPDMPTWLNHLGNAHRSRFERLGNLEDIDKAIKFATHALSLTPEDHLDMPKQLNILVTAHQSRFKRLGKLEDIDKAIDYGARAVAPSPEDHPRMPEWLNNLGIAHWHRFERLGKLEDINNAIECATRALSLAPAGHPDMPLWLSNLGNAHRCRFERLGKLEDLDEAIKFGTRAVSLTPEGHPDMPMWLNNLGVARWRRFEQLDEQEDIDRAIECGTRAVSLAPEGHPDMPLWLNNLGNSHRSQFHSTSHSNLHALTQSLDCYRKSSQLSTGRPLLRFRAAREWAKLAPLHPNSDLLSAHQTAMALVPEVVWLGETIGQRYEDVQTVAEAVLEAAAAAIDAQEYTSALEWLEQGRSIVWNQILQLRNPVDDLSDAHPSLAANLRELAGQLHSAGSTPSSLPSSTQTPLSLEEAAQKHRQLAGQYEALLKQIRALPGFESFLGPKKVSELLTAVQNGPVIVINVHDSRCDALIMLPGDSDIKHVPLPDLTAEKVADARAQLQGTLEQHGLRDRSGSRRPDRSAMKPRGDSFKEVLMILWSSVVKPILDFLGYPAPPGAVESFPDTTSFMHMGGAPTNHWPTVAGPIKPLGNSQASAAELRPHITWCATGALSLLPLHAAGNYDQSGENLFSYAISSFTPTISALLPSTHPRVAFHSRLLAIGQEATPGQNPLPGTRDELVAIRSCVQPPLDCMRIEGSEATRAKVLEAIERHDWVHLACHAHQDAYDPTESGFFLHNGMLSLATITQKSFKNKGLAFLSACQTATGDRKIADEAVHLASGMLMAGYPSVIGTMWSVKDADAPIIAREVYGRLLKDGKMNHRDAARALHEAVGKLREKVGEKAFERWAAFIHIGI